MSDGTIGLPPPVDPSLTQVGNTDGSTTTSGNIQYETSADGKLQIKDVIVQDAAGNVHSMSIDNQGVVTFTGPNGESLVYSLDSNNPALTPPTKTTNVNNLISHSGGNEWFAVSFMAVFTTIMAELTKVLSRIRYEEGMEAIQARQLAVASAESRAELTKASAKLQAQQEIATAIMSFATAGMAALTIVSTAMIQSRIDKNPDVAKAKAEAEKSQLNLDNAIKLQAGKSSDKMLTPDSFKQNPGAALEKYPTLKENYQAYTTANSKYENTKYSQEQISLQKLRSVESLVNNLNQGAGATARAVFTEAKGVVDALGQMFDLYSKTLQEFAQSSQKARDDFSAAFNEMIRAMKETVSKNIHAFDLKS